MINHEPFPLGIATLSCEPGFEPVSEMLMDAGSECGHHVYLGMCQNQKKQGGAPIQIRQRGLLAITFGFMLDISRVAMVYTPTKNWGSHQLRWKSIFFRYSPGAEGFIPILD